MANSEKYIVCEGYNNHGDWSAIECFIDKYTHIIGLIDDNNADDNDDKSDVDDHDKSDHDKSDLDDHDKSDVDDHDKSDHDNTHIIERLLGRIEIPYYFVNKIEDYNAILGQQQIENINATINKIVNRDAHTDYIRDLVQVNVGKCIQWCNRHEIPISSIFT